MKHLDALKVFLNLSTRPAALSADWRALTANLRYGPYAARDTPVSAGSRTEVCALLEEGILNVKSIDPGHDTGPGMITRVVHAAARSTRAGQLRSRFR